MNYIALICARGGSKGLPMKNIKTLSGVPLIGWSINIAKSVDRISRIIVSTDSKKIANIALEYGAEIPFMRPKHLSLDNSSEWLVWRHVIEFLESEPTNLSNINGIVVLPATSPLRSIEDVNKCIDLFEKGGVDSVITVCESSRNPHFNMVVKDAEGLSKLACKTDEFYFRRQDAPKFFDITTVAYILDLKFIKYFNNLFEGRVKSVEIPKDRAIDIDDIYDFNFAKSILNDKLLKASNKNVKR
jgi:CMP-N-acetylneuraminic acid synthetase